MTIVYGKDKIDSKYLPVHLYLLAVCNQSKCAQFVTYMVARIRLLRTDESSGVSVEWPWLTDYYVF
jgi:hypothetical protein